MPYRRRGKSHSKPTKLTDFYSTPYTGHTTRFSSSQPQIPASSQPGELSSPSHHQRRSTSLPSSPDREVFSEMSPSRTDPTKGTSPKITSHATYSAPTSPASDSPLKQRPRLDNRDFGSYTSPPTIVSVSPETDLITDMPASDVPVTEVTLKKMLLMLDSSISSKITLNLQPLRQALDEIETRVEHAESKMAEFASSHNNLIDAHYDLETDVTNLRAKIADLEDRSRRNNIKLRGIPESVTTKELSEYVTDLMSSLLPDCSSHDLLLDRIHRVPLPKHLDDSVPRDVLARVNFFHVKEALMQKARNKDLFPDRFQAVSIYTDLSAVTLQLRRSLAPVTTALRNKKIMYKWGFPTRLVIQRGDAIYMIRSLTEGVKILNSWGITVDTPGSSASTSSPQKVNSGWNIAGKHRRNER